ncbi:hypothetical protein NKR23_g11901 [Pleurostoma richardsiae]|uniref:Uncharacterized protein n=1 Tax=Pleurostoma richardsiae TaxID=41990 RepID=A0AA38R2D6_9PEZI|nr:hypothetical protein NKR23_g11901 [Pleurostoma richardsiae]
MIGSAHPPRCDPSRPRLRPRGGPQLAEFTTQAMCACGEEGSTTAMSAFLRQLGMALGVGVDGSTFQNAMALKLGREGFRTELC